MALVWQAHKRAVPLLLTHFFYFFMDYCENVIHETLTQVEQNEIRFNHFRNVGVVNKKISVA